MANNFTKQTIKQQLATRSGQVAVTNKNGAYQYTDTLTGKTLQGVSVDTSFLVNPQKPNDPKLTAKALDLARGYFTNPGTPKEMIEAIASVAAYVSATNRIPITSLFENNKISLQLISAYNTFKPKGSQVGVFIGNGNPAWVNNPSLRGSVAAAITDQP